MTGLAIRLTAPDEGAFAPFGRFLGPPGEAGTRRFYSEALDRRPKDAAPVLHVNAVAPSSLPLTVTGMERHPRASQVFAPLDVARYVVAVMPDAADGSPDRSRAIAFLMPGTLGVIFNPGTWHLGATVLDRPGSFAVLMWRGGRHPDDEFRAVPPLVLTEAG